MYLYSLATEPPVAAGAVVAGCSPAKDWNLYLVDKKQSKTFFVCAQRAKECLKDNKRALAK